MFRQGAAHVDDGVLNVMSVAQTARGVKRGDSSAMAMLGNIDLSMRMRKLSEV